MRFYEFLSNRDLHTIEDIAERAWKHLGVDIEFTKHFIERANDPRNGTEITAVELAQLFVKEYNQHGKQIAELPPNSEIIMTDLLSKINVPINIKKTPKAHNNKIKDTSLVAKTVMRKDDFKGGNKRFNVK